MSWDSTVVDSPSCWGEWATVSMVGEGGIIVIVTVTTWCVAAAAAATDVFDFIVYLNEVKCIRTEDVGPYHGTDFWREEGEEGGCLWRGGGGGA